MKIEFKHDSFFDQFPCTEDGSRPNSIYHEDSDTMYMNERFKDFFEIIEESLSRYDLSKGYWVS